jgi:hypothetical protein
MSTNLSLDKLYQLTTQLIVKMFSCSLSFSLNETSYYFLIQLIFGLTNLAVRAQNVLLIFTNSILNYVIYVFIMIKLV